MLRKAAILAVLASCFYAEAQLYACKHAHAAQTNTFGTPWPTPVFPDKLCVGTDPKHADWVYAPPCNPGSIGYIDAYRQFHLTAQLTSQRRRFYIKTVTDYGYIQP